MDIKSRFFPALALAGALGLAAPACATSGYVYERSAGYGRGPEVSRIAHDNGFREGREDGNKDARKGRTFDPSRHGNFRDADDGYHRDFGDKDFYRQQFREGYRAGYTDSFNAYAREYRR